MTYTAPLQLTRALHAALHRPSRGGPRQNCGQAAAARFSSKPWVFLTDLSEEIEMHDRRFAELSALVDDVCRMLEVPVQWVAYRPTSHRSEFLLHAAVSPVDAAAIFVRLERLGLTVNARPFVDAVKASVAGQDLLSHAAVDVLFYEQTRDRKQIRIRTGASRVSAQPERFHTEHGYLIEFAQDGDQAELLIQGPLYQEPKPEFSATCTYCGMEYIRRNYDSVLAHRAYHRRKRHCYAPRPNPLFVQRLADDVDGDRVDSNSPVWMHHETYERAVMFKREMGFDWAQWESPPACGRPVTETGVAYLLGTPAAPGVIVGACAFREEEGVWKLDWAWVAPKWRRHGVLRGYWARFVAKYGDFRLEYPVSPEMQAFVLKHGTFRQREVMQRNLQRLAARS